MENTFDLTINHVGNAKNNNAVLLQDIDKEEKIPIMHRSKMTIGITDDVTKTLHRNWRKSLLKPEKEDLNGKRALDSFPLDQRKPIANAVESDEERGRGESIANPVIKVSHEDPLQSSFGYNSSFRKDLKEAYHLLDETQPEGLKYKIKRNLFNFISTDRQPKLSVYCKCIEKLASRSYTDQSEEVSSPYYMTSFLDTAGKLFAQLFGCDIPDET
ncbi:hypothetical protein BSL78_17671 [Apostichopus japonicus]|uniref:Uncharacterized protein n=1 Tax=Stichopus japonicus TaxID=307972 RepID=A0A2G8KBU1_STIJA|nr:hypothetical protein BSL78_17671 [Apostichopus japonicus]